MPPKALMTVWVNCAGESPLADANSGKSGLSGILKSILSLISTLGVGFSDLDASHNPIPPVATIPEPALAVSFRNSRLSIIFSIFFSS
jgi:hypothetical protein